MTVEEQQQRPDRQKVFDYLGRVFGDPEFRIYFEVELEKLELLAGLEEKGILPTGQF